MHRSLGRLLVVGGLAVLFAAQVGAQSMAKLGGPVVDIDGLKSQVYEHWKVNKAAEPFVYSFALPKDLKSDKDMAELVIYPTTKSGDDVVKDWKDRFTPPKGFKIDEVARGEKFKVGKADVTKLLVMGTYASTAKPDDSPSEAKKLENQRLLGYIIETPNKKFVVRLTGPFSTVGLHVPDTDKWIRALK